MKLTTQLCLALACFTLLWGSIANAASDCCMSLDQAESQMDQPIPCHDMANMDKAQDDAECDRCDCQHCMKISMAPIQSFTQNHASFHVMIAAYQRIGTHQPESLFQPPRTIS